MNFDLYTIIYLLTNLFGIEVNRRFMRAFFEKQRSKNWMCAASYIAYFVITSILYLFFDIPLLTLVTNYVLYLLIAMNYEACMKKRILSSLYILILCVVTEIIIAACSGYFQFSVVSKGGYSNVIGVIAVPMLTYIEALLLYHFSSVRRNNEVSSSVWIASIAIPVITFVLHVIVVRSENVTQNEVILSTGLILVMNVTTFYLYDSLSKSYRRLAEAKVQEMERELYYNQCVMMQDASKELKSFRHDIKNQLMVIGNLLNKENYEEAQKLTGILFEDLDTTLLLCNTGNIQIDSIINYKLQNAVKDKIQINVDIAVPGDLNIGISDCIIVFGNLLDNSIEALRNVEESSRYLNLKINYDKGRMLIRCMNPYKEELNHENGSLATTKSNTDEHGIGLQNIQKVAKKYGGCVAINHENQVFDIQVLLYLSNNDIK